MNAKTSFHYGQITRVRDGALLVWDLVEEVGRFCPKGLGNVEWGTLVRFNVDAENAIERAEAISVKALPTSIEPLVAVPAESPPPDEAGKMRVRRVQSNQVRKRRLATGK